MKDTPPEFGIDVTRANNRQNRIENRDFVSQDPEQVRIKTELAIEGIEYNIIRSDLFQPSDKVFDLNEATVALACASGSAPLSTLAKGAIGKFYEDLNSGIYKSLFNPNVHGVYVYNCVKVDRKINDILKEKINKLPQKSGRNYGLLVHGNRLISLLVMKKLFLKSKMNSMNYAIDDNELQLSTESVINNVSRYLETKYKDSILGSLFKNNTKCEDIIQNA